MTALVSVQNILQCKYAQNYGVKKNQWNRSLMTLYSNRSLMTLYSNCGRAQNFPSETITGRFVGVNIFCGL